MRSKREILDLLDRESLQAVADRVKVEVGDRRAKANLVAALDKSPKVTALAILEDRGRDDLKEICRRLGLDDGGREKADLIERILGGDAKPAPPAQTWIGFPEMGPSRAADGPGPPAPAMPSNGDLALTVEVEPRKPRLAWQGMARKEIATAVPTQVVEIVRPGRAVERSDELAGLATRQVTARDVTMLPPNRLIWTNDNLVALQTLLDERDPGTHDYRYRGKVDLVYIDPPFMVNNDFRADNAIDIELDEDVQAKKEPSLVEILAYRDTWRQGLDSFLTMLRRRLELLKDLLAPTGSIYVHLDWHAVHYVKVLLDEIFGYENFRAQIEWKRVSAHANASAGFATIVDYILFYAAGPNAFWNAVFEPQSPELVRSHYSAIDPASGRRYALRDLTAAMSRASESQIYEWRGMRPKGTRCWAYTRENMDRLFEDGRIHFEAGKMPRLRLYLDENRGNPLGGLWDDLPPVNSQAIERLDFPTQKPVALVARIIAASCPPGGLVLDCFMGSGTTCEAAERLGRRWIGIDNGKYAIHLARKRLIQLDGQPRPPEKAAYDYVECERCRNIERKEKPRRSPGPFSVRPFTVENMGVYQRAEAWQDFQTQRSRYRDEMIKVFGGEPVNHSPLLHGRAGSSWVHVGPLDGPVSSGQVWNIAREAQRTGTKAVTVLSADFDTLSGSEKDEIKEKTGVGVIIRVIPANAIDEVRRRLELQRSNPDAPVESMAVPAFYAPLSIVLGHKVSGRTVQLRLDRCEVDIESFLRSQRPVLKTISDGMSAAARKKAQAEQDKWDARRKELEKWLAKATSWQKFVDFWSVDWDYGSRVSPDGKPIFETDWQSFRVRRGKDEVDALVFVAEFKYADAGKYRVAARVTDVFGNDGIATVIVEVK
jgi:adenine-specific DNA-methyltransferase